MNQHYFSETPASEYASREIDVQLAGAPRRVLSAGGVFSPDHLDEGTRVLLRTLESLQLDADAVPGVDVEAAGSSTGPILDLGCGWGPIALSAALHQPDAEVWAVDVNERARALTAENARRLGLDHLHVAAPEDVPTDLRFAAIHSNPPIRVGKPVLHSMLRQWLARLAVGGSAHLVVAKHLGAESLQRWLTHEFPGLNVSRIARDKGFHVIEARDDTAAR